MICERPDIHKDYDDGGDYQIKPAALSLKENIPPLSSLSLPALCQRPCAGVTERGASLGRLHQLLRWMLVMYQFETPREK